jgi:hypothetical protein
MNDAKQECHLLEHLNDGNEQEMRWRQSAKNPMRRGFEVFSQKLHCFTKT